MSNNTPEALRLARMIEHYNAGVGSQRIVEDYQQAAGELRRLYFKNEKLRAALAEQPAEQEPVAWIDITDEGQIVSSPRMYSDGSREERPLYTAPQPRRRLTDEEIGQVRWQCRWNRMSTDDNLVSATTQQLDAFARAIIAKVKGGAT